jgi:hypothetical protein
LGISYASVFELVLVSLALVYYALISDMSNGKSDIIEYCQGIVNDSPDYQGHDHRWSAPNSWRYARQFQLVQARQRITDATSMRHKGGDVQAVEYVAYHTYSITLVATDVNENKRRLVLGPKYIKRGRKTLFDPSGTSKQPKFRLISMLPAIVRTVIAEYDHFDRLLQQAVHTCCRPMAHLQKQRSSVESAPWRQSHTTYLILE